MPDAHVHKGQPPPSRPLDVHRWSDYPKLNSCLTDLIAEIEHAEIRRRARSSGSATRLRNAVRCIILDLYVAWSTNPDYEIGVSLGKESFRHQTRYDALFLRYDTFHPAYSGLVDLGYVQITRAPFHDPRTGIGRVTRIRATPKLIELLTGNGELTLATVRYRTDSSTRELIVLRDKDKNDVAYKDTGATKTMRADLERINAALSAHWTDLYKSDLDLAALNEKMTARYRLDDHTPPYIDFTARQLRRVFNNSDWRQGGRFYGGWWQTIPRDERKHITINGKHTVEVDYSGMHPALMYAEVEARLEGDPYDIDLPSVPRDVVKRAFNKLVNASGRTRPTREYNVKEYGLSWMALLELVKARHRPIAEFLGTGEGVRLQNMDAKIANRIVLRFLDMGYVCLPVHDSFIVHRELRDELTSIMRDEFHKAAGAYISTKAKLDVTRVSITEERIAIVSYAGIDDPFGSAGEYTGHETRLSNWWANQVPKARRGVTSPLGITGASKEIL
jgi:hypothetical protein